MGGKGATLNARITGETRAALEAEAARTGRSISQVAQIWLEQARAMPADLRDLVTWMSSVRERIRGRIGDPEASYRANLALREAWRGLVEELVAPVPYRGDNPEDEALVKAEGDYLDARDEFLAEVDRALFEHLQSGRPTEQLDGAVKLLIAPTLSVGPEGSEEAVSALRLLRERSENWFAVGEILQEVSRESPRFEPFITAMNTAVRALQRAQWAADRADDLIRDDAEKVGREVSREAKS